MVTMKATSVSLLHSSLPEPEPSHAQSLLATKMVRGSEQVSENCRLPRDPMCVHHREAPRADLAVRKGAGALAQRDLEVALAPCEVLPGWVGTWEQD